MKPELIILLTAGLLIAGVFIICMLFYKVGYNNGKKELSKFMKEREGLFKQIEDLSGRNTYMKDILTKIHSNPNSGLFFQKYSIGKDKFENVSPAEFFENWKNMRAGVNVTIDPKEKPDENLFSKEELQDLYNNIKKTPTPADHYKPSMTKEEYIESDDQYIESVKDLERKNLIFDLREIDAIETTPFEFVLTVELRSLHKILIDKNDF